MQLSHNFPELNPGQVKMLERYVVERESQAIERYKDKQKQDNEELS